MYSTRNHPQYPVTDHKRKDYEKECVNITGSLGCIAETDTKL